MKLYFEDLTVGRVFPTRLHTITADEIQEFAHTFDPQTFHMNPERAKDTFFRTHVASGWHTACLTMRLMVDSELGKLTGGLVGMGADKMRWPRPTFPGETLASTITVREARPSKTRPGYGVVVLDHVTTSVEKGDVVFTMSTSVLAPMRK